MPEIIAVSGETLQEAVSYIWGRWGGGENRAFYADCIGHSLDPEKLPKFYLAREGGKIAGCVALLVNDLVSRQDLMPWVACVYVEPERRGRGLGGMLLKHALAEAQRLGFDTAFLLTDHIGYYERYGWEYLCQAYGLGDECSRVYRRGTRD